MIRVPSFMNILGVSDNIFVDERYLGVHPRHSKRLTRHILVNNPIELISLSHPTRDQNHIAGRSFEDSNTATWRFGVIWCDIRSHNVNNNLL